MYLCHHGILGQKWGTKNGPPTAKLYDDWIYENVNELKHHGIKGQKWGVRRYQNADGTLTAEGKERYSSHDITLKPDTSMFRIAKENEKEIYSGSYAALKSTSDYNKYVGVYAGLLANEGQRVVEKQLSTVGYLKIPSHKNSVKTMGQTLDSLNFRNDIGKQKELKKYLLNEISDENNKSDRLFSKGVKELDAYIKSGKIGKNLYDTLNVSFSDKRDNIMRPIINAYMNNLKNNGYAAVMDMNDTKYGVYNSDFPIIIADVAKFKVTNIARLSRTDMEQAKALLDDDFLNSLRWE